MKKIIVGVDGSVPSRAAVRWSVEEALATGAEVALAHVIDTEWGTVSPRMVDEVGRNAAELVERERHYAQGLAPTLDVQTLVLRGSPMWELAQLSFGETLLAVGTHKSGFHYGRAFGSRSLQLATLAAGAVVVVPESAVRFRSGVVVGVDPTPTGMEAIDLAADEASRRNAELTLVRASTLQMPIGFDDDERRDWQARTDEAARNVLASAVDRARRRCPDTTIRSRVVRRPAGAALNELARAAEVLVIGDSRRPGAQPGTLGSVAYDVLLNLTSPTLVVHANLHSTEAIDLVADSAATEGEHHATR
ncbi:universal stress protein [Leifsonia sp. NPDC058248]|uniref:universal stress protein n=1 Tax=Leifsonia sp. NPDC058248 TaxID=3346402 RepID=UPI0036D9520C